MNRQSTIKQQTDEIRATVADLGLQHTDSHKHKKLISIADNIDALFRISVGNGRNVLKDKRRKREVARLNERIRYHVLERRDKELDLRAANEYVKELEDEVHEQKMARKRNLETAQRALEQRDNLIREVTRLKIALGEKTAPTAVAPDNGNNGDKGQNAVIVNRMLGTCSEHPDVISVNGQCPLCGATCVTCG